MNLEHSQICTIFPFMFACGAHETRGMEWDDFVYGSELIWSCANVI